MSAVLTDCLKQIDAKQKGRKRKHQQTQTLISSVMIDQTNKERGKNAIEIFGNVSSFARVLSGREKKDYGKSSHRLDVK